MQIMGSSHVRVTVVVFDANHVRHLCRVLIIVRRKWAYHPSAILFCVARSLMCDAKIGSSRAFTSVLLACDAHTVAQICISVLVQKKKNHFSILLHLIINFYFSENKDSLVFSEFYIFMFSKKIHISPWIRYMKDLGPT